jgi:hypothetical protein
MFTAHIGVMVDALVAELSRHVKRKRRALLSRLPKEHAATRTDQPIRQLHGRGARLLIARPHEAAA